MHSESTVVMYQSLLKHIYDMRRARYGLHHRVGLLVADAFTGNFARKEGVLTAFTYLVSALSFFLQTDTVFVYFGFCAACQE